MKNYIPFCLLLASLLPARANIKLPSFFTDNMVLQQHAKVHFSGTANASSAVTINTSWDHKTYRTTADDQGTWKIDVPTPSYGGPYQIDLSDGETKSLKNILIGDVWFCSGQSNMEMPLAGWGKIQHYEQEIQQADYPEIRLLQVLHTAGQKPEEEARLWEGGWQPCSPKSIPEFSSTAYFFAREVYQKTHIPIGLIHSSWGGTYVEAWMSGEALGKFPEFQDTLRKVQLNTHFDLKQGNQPAVLYNAMVKPFIHFPIKGAIWYQGEANAGRAIAYRQLFPAMINDWRKQWGQGDFPFYFVQLANYMKREAEPVPSDWAMLREAQGYALKLPKTGMAVIIDIGNADDIHPKDKQDVGKRLALQALHGTYGKAEIYSGPVLQKQQIKGNQVILNFNTEGSPMVLKGSPETKVFAIAGEDRKFYWARVKQEGNRLILSSPQVEAPVAVRYAWANNPEAILFNEAGLPTSPFRTDQWD